ncbi:MAG: HEAT repeat domain-containing protein [Gemmatimonadetes bacterium]|nr:HEAT repeat domain-containing protein [Gemmatimonadota bacterium]
MNSPRATVSNNATELPEPPFEPALVEEMLRQLDKTVRAHQLYMHNNPTYLKSLENLRATFAPIWEHTDSLPLQVSDSQLTWMGRVVREEPEKASDSLPWTLYKDGVREITLAPGFEGQELEWLLDIIPRVRKAQDHEDDLLTLLWEQEFSFLTYRYVDVSGDPALPLDQTATAGRWPVGPGEVVENPIEAIEDAKEEAQEGEGKPGQGSSAMQESPKASGLVRMEDFDSTLYFLEAGEIEYLRREAEREYQMDLRHGVLNALFDIFELQPDPLVRREVAQDIEALTLHLLAGRQFGIVAFLLREVEVVLERARDLPPEIRQSFARLPDRLSEPSALSQLIEAMDEAATLPAAADLEGLFERLRPAALGTVFHWLGQLRNAQLRPLLERAADRLAQSNTAELVRLIVSDDPVVALEAVKRSAALKTPAAVPPLGKALVEGARDLRVAAVTALVEIGTAGALQALERALDDTDRDVRLGAIRALTAKAYRPALARVTTMLKSKDLKELDRTERVSVFELYGTLCGDAGVPYLDELLNPKSGLFSRKEDPDVRACAALALGRVGTPKAQASLQKAAAEKDVIVRTAVNRALKVGGP